MSNERTYSPESHNYEYASAAVGSVSATADPEFNADVRADALIHATLAAAYEQRTANLIASLQIVRYEGAKEILPTADHAWKTVGAINERLGLA